MKNLFKHTVLFLVGAFTYVGIEMLFRGYSHISMFILGGFCFICVGLINEYLSWETPLWLQAVIGGVFVVTPLEFITGCIVNLWLGLNVWHYEWFDILGQICIPFTLIWCLLSVVAIILDDALRWLLFGEEKPHYKLK